jgi:hypothetical protein
MNLKKYVHSPKTQFGLEEDHICQRVAESIRQTELKFSELSTSEIRQLILDKLRHQGWSDPVRLSASSNITVTSMREDIALCLQTGNMSRFYADLLKLQYLFTSGKIKGAIYLICTKRRAAEIGSNVANFERLVEELQLFQDVITAPIYIIGLD